MALLKISRIGHPVLRQVATPIPTDDVTTPEVQRLIADMVDTMRDAGGVGLAGPQVYALWRVIVIDVPAGPRGPAVPLTVLVNPVIESHADDTVDDWEGCLSIPDLRGRVPRWPSLRVSGLDHQGQPVAFDADGFFARVIQHEIDHLDGVLFPERMSDLRTLSHLGEMPRT